MAAIVLTVGGVTELWEPGTLTIEDRIRARSILTCEIRDAAATKLFARGQQVVLTVGGVTEYSGHVWDAVSQRVASTGELLWFLRVTDESYLVEKRIIAAGYLAQTSRAIIEDMINDAFVEEGVVGWTEQYLELDGTLDRADSDFDAGLAGDLEIVIRVRAADWTPAVANTLVAQWTPAGNQRGWLFNIDPAGTLAFFYSTDGTNAIGRFSTVTLASAITGLTDDVTDVWLRVVFDADNGASGHDVKFYWQTTAIGNPHDPTSTAWTQLGATVTNTPTAVLFNTTAFVKVGANEVSTQPFNGRVYRMELRNEVGDLIGNPRFDRFPEWNETKTSAIDSKGKTWTLKDNAVIVRVWTVDVGPTVTITFDFDTGDIALDRLAERAQFWWNVDSDRILHWAARTDTVAPFTASPSTNMLHRTPRVQHTRALYRNSQYVTGGFDTTTSQIEIFAGDGQRLTFNTAFPVFSVPTVETNLAGAGYTTKTVGIRGVDTGKDFYWSKTTTEINQDTGGTILTTADLLRVTYVGMFPMVILSTDQSEIDPLAVLEDASGKVFAVERDATIEARARGFDIAAALLAQFGSNTNKLEFSTDVSGAKPGQLLTVNLPDQDLDGDTLLIEEVVTTHLGGEKLRYRITAAQGPPGKTWAEFFRFLLVVQAPDVGQADLGIVTLLETLTATVNITEVVTATVQACPVPDTTLFPATTLLPC